MFDYLKGRAALPFVALIAVSSLVACNRNDQAKPAAAAPAASASQAQADAPLKVGFVYIGHVGDGGWTYAHDRARKAVEAELGNKIKTTVIENVPEAAEAENAFRDLAKQGNQLIFGTTFGYMEPMLKVAKEFPDVKFEHATGYKTADNMGAYEARTYEGAYLAGIIAGKMTKTNQLGFVASIPIPEVIRNINAYTLGAQSVNPKAVTRIVWVNKWFDEDKERSGALALIANGADVLIQNTDSPAVLKTAQEKGVMAFGWDSDMTTYGPKAHLGSAAIDWAPYYKKVMLDVLDHTWKPGQTWGGVRQGMIKIASPAPTLPQDVILLLGERTNEMRAGKLKPFQGPLFRQDGSEIIAAGKSVDDKDLKEMNYYVKGVEGVMPSK
jgi:simple sugar transport system substrate-binding protein